MAEVEGRVYCDKCSELIERPNEAWWEYVGWAKRRKQGGIHSLTLPQRTDAVMCGACMMRVKMDLQHGPGATSLF